MFLGCSRSNYKKIKNHMIASNELGMAVETDTTFHEWLSDVLNVRAEQ